MVIYFYIDIKGVIYYSVKDYFIVDFNRILKGDFIDCF